MISEIMELREKGLSFRKIAKQLGTTVGKVQYQWVKYQKELDRQQVEKKKKRKKRVGKSIVSKMPTEIQKNEVFLIYSSPTRIFCYWEIDKSWYVRLLKSFDLHQESNLPKVLRLYDITSISFNGHNQHHYFDSYIPETVQEWFLSGLKENRTYCVDLGIKLPSGKFIALSRSNVIHTPRTSFSQECHSLQELRDYERGEIKEPKWVEHVSTYSYYVTKQEGK
jgi:uncharacterized protein